MNNQTEQQNSTTQETDNGDDSTRVNIQPSETETEENAPGRTAGKAEGSSEIVEADLADKNQ